MRIRDFGATLDVCALPRPLPQFLTGTQKQRIQRKEREQAAMSKTRWHMHRTHREWRDEVCYISVKIKHLK
jgi:hypothetical protein